MASAAAAGTNIVRRLRRIVGFDGVLDRPSDLLVYARDASAMGGPRPGAVVFPRSAGQVSEIVKLCQARAVPYVPRGAGTGLSGGCVADGGGRCRGPEPPVRNPGGEPARPLCGRPAGCRARSLEPAASRGPAFISPPIRSARTRAPWEAASGPTRADRGRSSTGLRGTTCWPPKWCWETARS